MTVEDKLTDRYGRGVMALRRYPQRSDQQRRGRLHRPRQPHRAAQIGHRRRRAVAEGRPDLQLVVVLGGPAEPHAQRPGERRLDDAGVGAGMTAGVATPGRAPHPTAIRRRSARTAATSAAVTRAAT